MTDDQIRERAEQLGMVDSSELTLAALQNSAVQPTAGTPEETRRHRNGSNTTRSLRPRSTQMTRQRSEPETIGCTGELHMSRAGDNGCTGKYHGTGSNTTA